MKKKISVSLAIAIAIIAMTVTFSVTMILAMQMFDKTVSDVNEKQVMYNKLAELDKTTRDNYYGTINDQTLYDTLSTGYIAGLGDKYSKYYTAKQVNELNDTASGKLMGIGADMVKDASGYFRIVKIYAGSPAETIGLTKDTIVTKLDDTDLKALTLDTVKSMLKGESGTVIHITYLVNNKEQTVDLQRSVYETPSVEFELTDTVGYIKITTFTTDTAAKLDYAINSLKSQGATALVFDVRNNTGGTLSAAAECIDLLCPAGTIVSGVYKDNETKVLYTSDEKEVDMPMVVLTNGNTAFGAELFATSIRDFGKGKIVGTKTAGRGTVQKMYTMSDGSAVDLTVAVMVPGKSDSFDGVGITPDYEKALTAEEEQAFYDFTVSSDPQILRASEVAVSLAKGNSGNGPTGPAATQAPASSSQPAQESTPATTQSTPPASSAPASSAAQSSSAAQD